MRDHPPDEVAIIPGLRPWAQSAVEAATGHHARATSSAIEAAQAAARQGAAAMAMNFLTDAARYGDAREAAAVLPDLGLPLDTPVQQVRAADIMARAQRDPAGADRARPRRSWRPDSTGTRSSWPSWPGPPTSTVGYERPIAAVLRQARERLGRTQGSAAALAPSPLTSAGDRGDPAGRPRVERPGDRRGAGAVHSDRAEPPASAYRKLGIASRSELKA